jgi:hemoglobin-like flavoprotein
VTPEELDLVSQAGRVVAACPDRFAATFYETLFEISPTTRELFPDDMTAQKGKLVDEMAFLVGAARDLDAFVARAKDLGRRHVAYGVQHGDYERVGVALTSALRECMEVEWTDAHEAAWAKLYNLIADVMRDGARGSMFATDGRVG